MQSILVISLCFNTISPNNLEIKIDQRDVYSN